MRSGVEEGCNPNCCWYGEAGCDDVANHGPRGLGVLRLNRSGFLPQTFVGEGLQPGLILAAVPSVERAEVLRGHQERTKCV